jgi:hypothetical protein
MDTFYFDKIYSFVHGWLSAIASSDRKRKYFAILMIVLGVVWVLLWLKKELFSSPGPPSILISSSGQKTTIVSAEKIENIEIKNDSPDQNSSKPEQIPGSLSSTQSYSPDYALNNKDQHIAETLNSSWCAMLLRASHGYHYNKDGTQQLEAHSLFENLLSHLPAETKKSVNFQLIKQAEIEWLDGKPQASLNSYRDAFQVIRNYCVP